MAGEYVANVEAEDKRVLGIFEHEARFLTAGCLNEAKLNHISEQVLKPLGIDENLITCRQVHFVIMKSDTP